MKIGKIIQSHDWQIIWPSISISWSFPLIIIFINNINTNTCPLTYQLFWNIIFDSYYRRFQNLSTFVYYSEFQNSEKLQLTLTTKVKLFPNVIVWIKFDFINSHLKLKTCRVKRKHDSAEVFFGPDSWDFGDDLGLSSLLGPEVLRLQVKHSQLQILLNNEIVGVKFSDVLVEC
jgi:hypothetical protein